MPINETQGTRTIKNFPSKCAVRHQTYKWGVECRGSEPALLRRKVAKPIEISYAQLAGETGLSRSASQAAVGWLVRRELLSVNKETVTATPVYSVRRPWRR